MATVNIIPGFWVRVRQFIWANTDYWTIYSVQFHQLLVPMAVHEANTPWQ